MDPIPPINKVFALVTQEDNQRHIHNTFGNFDPVTLFVKNDTHRPNQGKTQKRERPICTHCGFSGHTIDKCYKLHGYPPGYQPRQRGNNSRQMTINNHTKNPVVSQVSRFISSSSQTQEVERFMQFLSPL